MAAGRAGIRNARSEPMHRAAVRTCDHQPRDLALFPLPLSLRMVEEMLAARGIVVNQETVRQWALK